MEQLQGIWNKQFIHQSVSSKRNSILLFNKYMGTLIISAVIASLNAG